MFLPRVSKIILFPSTFLSLPHASPRRRPPTYYIHTPLMPRSEMAILVVIVVLPLLTLHSSIAAVLLHNLDPSAGSNGASPASFYPPLSNGELSGDNNIIAASFAAAGETIPDEARTTEEALGYPQFISNEDESPQSFILGGTSSQCGKELNGQAQPNDSKRVRARETGGYCEPDPSPGFKSSPQNPTANPPQRPIQQGAGSSTRKNPSSAVIPSAAEDPTVNPLLCPNIERMIPVCHGMFDPVLGLGPFELERCSPSM